MILLFKWTNRCRTKLKTSIGWDKKNDYDPMSIGQCPLTNTVCVLHSVCVCNCRKGVKISIRLNSHERWNVFYFQIWKPSRRKEWNFPTIPKTDQKTSIGSSVRDKFLLCVCVCELWKTSDVASWHGRLGWVFSVLHATATDDDFFNVTMRNQWKKEVNPKQRRQASEEFH